MNLLSSRIIEYLYTDTQTDEERSAYEIYLEGVAKTIIELSLVYLPLIGDKKTELESIINKNDPAQIDKIITLIVQNLPQNYKTRFNNKLNELIEQYNSSVIKNAMSAMSPQDLEGFKQLLEGEKQEVKTIKDILTQRLAQETSSPGPTQVVSRATPEPPAPQMGRGFMVTGGTQDAGEETWDAGRVTQDTRRATGDNSLPPLETNDQIPNNKTQTISNDQNSNIQTDATPSIAPITDNRLPQPKAGPPMAGTTDKKPPTVNLSQT